MKGPLGSDRAHPVHSVTQPVQDLEAGRDRLSDRYIQEGLLNKKEYETYIKKLPDSEEKSEVLIIEEEEEAVEEAGVENPELNEEDNDDIE